MHNPLETLCHAAKSQGSTSRSEQCPHLVPNCVLHKVRSHSSALKELG